MGGSIIVLHAPSIPARFQTLEIIDRSVPLLRKRGFAFLRLTDLFAAESKDQGPGCVNCTFCSVSMVACMFVTLLFCCLRCVSSLRCFFVVNYELFWYLRFGQRPRVQPTDDTFEKGPRRKLE